MTKTLLLNFFLLIIITSIFTFTAQGQIAKWVDTDEDEDTLKGTVFIYAPRIGYSYYSSSLVEAGFGLYISKEDNTIEDVKESNRKNLMQISNSFNLTLEYSKYNSKSVWAPKLSYVFGYSFIVARADLLWQTENFKKGYLSSRLGLGLGFYNIGIFAMKNTPFKNNNPYVQNWGISFTTYIWGGKKRWKVKPNQSDD